MSVTLRFHRLATKDYLRSLRWYFRRSPTAAHAFVEKTNQAVERIREDPGRWPAYDSLHRWVKVTGFPFVLYFRTWSEDEVIVMAVAHARRRPGYWRRRKP